MTHVVLFLKKWAIPGLFFLYFRLFNSQFTVNKCPLYQLSHNHVILIRLQVANFFPSFYLNNWILSCKDYFQHKIARLNLVHLVFYFFEPTGELNMSMASFYALNFVQGYLPRVGSKKCSPSSPLNQIRIFNLVQ